MTKFSQVIALAEHYLAIGETEVWLDDEDPDLPWEFVSSVQTGGVHSFLGPRDVRFTAVHPSGLAFKWHAGLSPDRHGMVEEKPFFDVEAIAEMFERLPEDKRPGLAELIEKEVLPPLVKEIDKARSFLAALNVGRLVLAGAIAQHQHEGDLA